MDALSGLLLITHSQSVLMQTISVQCMKSVWIMKSNHVDEILPFDMSTGVLTHSQKRNI